MSVILDKNGQLASYHGFQIQIEVPKGKYRMKAGRKPVMMPVAYGEILGTKGADKEPIGCYIGDFSESQNVYVINQQNPTEKTFDEQKVMLGFLSEEEAIQTYQACTLDDSLMSIVPCTVQQFLWWLRYRDTSKPVTPESFPFDTESNIAMEQNNFDWSNPERAVSQALYQMRNTDINEQLLEQPSFNSVIDEILHRENGEFIISDALVVPYNKVEKTAQLIGRTLNRYGKSELKVVENGIQVTEPFKKLGTTNIAFVYELTDGQVITCFLHNPDKTPNKLQLTDNLIAWRWCLNKKDITILVSKENGKDQEITQIAQRVMMFAEKNSWRFAKANARREERLKLIGDTEARILEKEQRLQELIDQINTVKQALLNHNQKMGEPETVAAPEPVSEPTPVTEPNTTDLTEPAAVNEPEPEPMQAGEPEPAQAVSAEPVVTPEPEPENTPVQSEPQEQLEQDKAFLEAIIGRTADISANDFNDRFNEVAARNVASDNEEMKKLVEKAVFTYQDIQDELSKEDA